jgi:hypothetical protein
MRLAELLILHAFALVCVSASSSRAGMVLSALRQPVEPLPQGWTESWDEEHGCLSYYHQETEQFVFERPELPPRPGSKKAVAAAAAVAAEAAAGGSGGVRGSEGGGGTSSSSPVLRAKGQGAAAAAAQEEEVPQEEIGWAKTLGWGSLRAVAKWSA